MIRIYWQTQLFKRPTSIFVTPKITFFSYFFEILFFSLTISWIPEVCTVKKNSVFFLYSVNKQIVLKRFTGRIWMIREKRKC